MQAVFRSVHSLPLLVTKDRHLITEHVWPLLHKYKNKPQKTHGLWDSWGEEININLPPITKQFDDSHKFVWLPIDKESANNPWHVWIDVISKFRLLERRGATHFTKYVYIMSNPSKSGSHPQIRTQVLDYNYDTISAVL